MALATDLPPDYYLKNFRSLLEWVQLRYEDLLNPDELDFIAAFNRLNKPAQCLLVRLCSRKGPVFRLGKLNYPEIPSLDKAAEQLIAHNLLSTEQAFDLATLAGC